jgi:hypothetical protein
MVDSFILQFKKFAHFELFERTKNVLRNCVGLFRKQTACQISHGYL